MKKLILIILIGITYVHLPAQSWQELYSESGQYWGKDWKKCSEVLEKALIAAKAEFGEADSSYALTINDLGVSYMEMGDYQKAKNRLEKGLEIIGLTAGKNHPDHGMAQSNLGVVHMHMGNYERALPLLKAALANIEKNHGDSDPTYGIFLGNLGMLYQNTGEYEQALPYLKQALVFSEKNKGKDHPEYSVLLSKLGSLLKTMGNYDQALPLIKESLSRAEASLGKKHPYYIIAVSSLASLYKAMENYEEALPLYEEAVNSAEKILGKEHSQRAIRLHDLGMIYHLMGDYEKVLPLYEEALMITEKTIGKQHPSYGVLLNNVANLHKVQGDFEKALPVSIASLNNVEQTLGKQHTSYSSGLHNLARLYESMGNYDLAITTYQATSEAISSQLTAQFTTLNARLQTTFLQQKKPYFDNISSSIYRHPQFKDGFTTGFDQALLLKGFLQNNQIDLFQSLRTHPDTSIQNQYTRWENLHRILARQYQKPIKNRLKSFENLRNRADLIEANLANESLAFRIARKQTKWKEVQAVLEEGDVAIEFSHFPYYRGDKTDSVIYVAYLLQQGDEQPKMVVLFEEQELKSLLSPTNQKQNLDQLYAFRGVKPRKSQPDYLNLADLVWKPIDSLLSDVKTIYYSPSGLLNRMNLHAIHLDKKTLLGEKYELVQLGSTRSLVFEEDETTTYSNKTVMLLGGIQYTKDSTSGGITMRSDDVEIKSDKSELEKLTIASRVNNSQWNYLEGSAIEVQKIGQLLRSKEYEINLKTGFDATEEYLRNIESSPRILHIATHGYFFHDPEDQSIENQDDLPPAQLSDHPMVRSGLILAGANHAWTGNEVPEGQEDGILTAYEISRMDLSNTELVVLSACETGLGDIEGNEGVYGLQRAFKIAGAKYILMSLWQVPDQATQELMTVFYENWLGGMEIREAFRNAQKQMRKKYKEPYYWAGFVLVE